ncbi:hypothetical protein [Paraburkholderia youngii]|uniref:Uncharacterized protein n=1 Tax=Paraburkholderia youngii TaxID=2782701 RepID=A0A7Y6JVL9_9BURK|nr:hypothetical protein [Paraburkholderia youngii]NUX98754.1 hypothetical protein [Paraburkholderia youngii]
MSKTQATKPYQPRKVRDTKALVRAKLERAAADTTGATAERILGTQLGLAFAKLVVGRDF